jgi:hypothetical protein
MNLKCLLANLIGLHSDVLFLGETKHLQTNDMYESAIRPSLFAKDVVPTITTTPISSVPPAG